MLKFKGQNTYVSAPCRLCTSRYGDVTICCPSYNRDPEGGKTFLVKATKFWNSLPINIRSYARIYAFKQNYCDFIKEGYAGLDSFPIIPLNNGITFTVLFCFVPFLSFLSAFTFLTVIK